MYDTVPWPEWAYHTGKYLWNEKNGIIRFVMPLFVRGS